MPDIDEVNFWQPSGKSQFRALNPGEPFLFKLHSPHDFIAGGGFFAHSSILPVSLAWQAFAEKNGAGSLEEMRKLIEAHRRAPATPTEDYKIGCILLGQPFFFSSSEWIPIPADWKPNIVQGKSYETDDRFGKKLWEDVQLRLQGRTDIVREPLTVEQRDRYGTPVTVLPRLGQGSFRIIVTDVYQRRCAVTQERTLPALIAAHIKPYAVSGPHDIRNGILLRSDIHQLLDAGYVTISPDYHFEVSKRIHEEFENGGDYYAMHGRKLYLPENENYRPQIKFITWHNENKFRG
jgi:putative restriction endonuclease